MKRLFIDIGGTHLRSELVSSNEVLSQTRSTQTIDLLSFIDEMMEEHPEITFIGVSYAGQVHDGVILSSPNIALKEREIKKNIALRYGVRLEIDNDLNCAVKAEADHFESTNIAALYVGTGLGAAVIDHARLVKGGHNLSFELGHIPYKKAPFACGCGRENCVELFASGSGLAKWLHYYKRETRVDLQALKESSIEQERELVKEFEEALLHAVGTLITLTNSDILVLGGGIITSNVYLIEMIRTHIKAYALHGSLEHLRIEMTQLENAALSGARLLQVRANG